MIVFMVNGIVNKLITFLGWYLLNVNYNVLSYIAFIHTVRHF